MTPSQVNLYKLVKMTELLKKDLGRNPLPEEIATEIGFDVDWLYRLLNNVLLEK